MGRADKARFDREYAEETKANGGVKLPLKSARPSRAKSNKDAHIQGSFMNYLSERTKVLKAAPTYKDMSLSDITALVT